MTGFKPIKVHVSSFPEGGMTILQHSTGQRAVAAQDRVTRVPLNEAPAPPQAQQEVDQPKSLLFQP